MTTLYCSKVEIVDSIDNLSKMCYLTFLPSIETHVNQNSILSSMTVNNIIGAANQLPPIKNKVSITVNYNNNGINEVFHGYVLHSDDMTDPDKYQYRVVLTESNPKEPYKNTITFLLSSPDGTSSNYLKIKTFLKRFCVAAGCTIKRNDLEDYTFTGTMDCNRKSVIDTIRQVVQPFSQFDYLKYYIRQPDPDSNSLDIIKVDYNDVKVSKAFTISNIKEIERSFEKYTSNALIGNSDIICTGGEKYDDDTQFGKVTHKLKGTCHQDYSYSSKDSGAPLINGAPFDLTWVETTVSIDYDVEVSQTLPAGDPSTLIVFDTLEENIGQLSAGLIDDLQVINSRTTKKVTKSYNQLGQYSQQESYFTYETKIFNNGFYSTNGTGINAQNCLLPISPTFNPKSVLMVEQNYEFQFPAGEKFPFLLQLKRYQYNSVGVMETLTTTSFNYLRDQWTEIKTEVSSGDPAETANATIAFFNGFRNSKFQAPEQVTKPPLGKYITKNGVPVKPLQFKNLNCDTQLIEPPFVGFDCSVIGSAYDGLSIMHVIASTQRDLENTNVVWSIITGTMTYAPYIPVGVEGKFVIGDDDDLYDYGKITEVRHIFTENEALTKVSMKRIVRQ